MGTRATQLVAEGDSEHQRLRRSSCASRRCVGEVLHDPDIQLVPQKYGSPQSHCGRVRSQPELENTASESAHHQGFVALSLGFSPRLFCPSSVLRLTFELLRQLSAASLCPSRRRLRTRNHCISFSIHSLGLARRIGDSRLCCAPRRLPTWLLFALPRPLPKLLLPSHRQRRRRWTLLLIAGVDSSRPISAARWSQSCCQQCALQPRLMWGQQHSTRQRRSRACCPCRAARAHRNGLLCRRERPSCPI